MNKKYKKFEVHAYLEKKYKKYLKEYEENMGINGLDYVYSLESKEEVDEVFESYLK
jgi:hypothetical protein